MSMNRSPLSLVFCIIWRNKDLFIYFYHGEIQVRKVSKPSLTTLQVLLLRQEYEYHEYQSKLLLNELSRQVERD